MPKGVYNRDNLDLLVKATQYMTNYKEALEEING
jgi:hypothetical protein